MSTGMIQKSAAQIRESSTGRKSMNDLIKSMEPEIKKALPSVITPERFTRMVLSAISMTPKLADCTPMSFLGAMMQAAQLGVEPNTPLGQAYLIPYNNKNTLECQFQLGYKGLIDLAYRSGEVEIVQAQIVYANDTFECEFGLNPRLKHVPAADDRGEPVKVYAIFKTKAGGYGFDVMSMADVRKHAQKYRLARPHRKAKRIHGIYWQKIQKPSGYNPKLGEDGHGTECRKKHEYGDRNANPRNPKTGG